MGKKMRIQYIHPPATKPSITSLLWGILAGAVVAGAVTLLLTPNSGKATRSMIKDRSLQARDIIIFRAREAAQSVGHDGHKK